MLLGIDLIVLVLGPLGWVPSFFKSHLPKYSRGQAALNSRALKSALTAVP